LLLGGFASLAVTEPENTTGARRILLAAGIAGSVLSLVAAVWMFANLSHGAPDKFAAAQLDRAMHLSTSPRYSGLLGIHLLLTAIIPVAFVCRIWPGRRDSLESRGIGFSFTLLFVVVALGTVIGRVLMY
jgi:hypothetical protein